MIPFDCRFADFALEIPGKEKLFANSKWNKNEKKEESKQRRERERLGKN